MRARLATGLIVCAAFAAPASALADIPASLKHSCELRDALDNDTANGARLSFYYCSDGRPAAGGREPNEGATSAVAVPQSYRGYRGLPPKAAPEPGTGADSNGDIALDVHLALPDPRRVKPPKRGYPLLVMMHGCCGGQATSHDQRTVDGNGSAEGWHYSPQWFASRGYVVLTYTSRGFVNGSGNGSTGVMHLQDRRYEMNDMQSLAGQIADTSFDPGGPRVRADGRRVVVTGGSYGGGFSWMALTDPTWKSPRGRPMRLAAVAPKYGWTDLAQAIVPNGHAPAAPLPPFDGSATRSPVGFPKLTILSGLYATGVGLVPGNHTTFDQSITEAVLCLDSADPVASNPLCAEPINKTLPGMVDNNSAYFQNHWFKRVKRRDPGAVVPVFSAGTFTDPLFPGYEHRRMAERILKTHPRYPIQEYYGDYQHFAQDKRAEWSDLCGGTETCEAGDYPGYDFDEKPKGFSARGATGMLNRFIDHYARPPENTGAPKPRQDVTASLQVCPDNASARYPLDGPGQRYTAQSFSALAPKQLRFDFTGSQSTTSLALPNVHAVNADPVLNERLNGKHCPVETGPAGPGVATYTSPPLERGRVMIGPSQVVAHHTGTGVLLQLNSRLYDVFPNGRAVMVDRGVYRPLSANATSEFTLHGNGWRFPKGHRVRLELAQDDAPFIKPAIAPSSLTLQRVRLSVPVRR